MPEQRQHPRLKIDRSIVFVGINHNNEVEVQGIGRALDISPKGMMFESAEPIYVRKLTFRASSDQNDSMEINAQVIYSMPHSPGTYRTGVMFTGAEKAIEGFVAEMLKG